MWSQVSREKKKNTHRRNIRPRLRSIPQDRSIVVVFEVVVLPRHLEVVVGVDRGRVRIEPKLVDFIVSRVAAHRRVKGTGKVGVACGLMGLKPFTDGSSSVL